MIEILKPGVRQPLRCSCALLPYGPGMELANEHIAENEDLFYGYVLRADVSLQHGKVDDAMIDIGVALNMIRDFDRLDYEDAKVYALRGFAHSLPTYSNGDLAHRDYAKAMEILSKEYPVRLTANPDDSKSPSEIREEIVSCTIEMREKYFRYGALIRRAKSHSDLGNCRFAFRDLARAIELLPSQPSAYLARAELRVADDDDGPFMADLDQATRHSGDSEGYIVLAKRQHSILMDSVSAMVTIDRALQINANNWMAHCLRGEILLESEDFAGAIDEFRKTVSLFPHAPVCHLKLAELLEGDEDFLGAKAEYEKFIKEADKADVLGIIDVIQHIKDDLDEKIAREGANDVDVEKDLA